MVTPTLAPALNVLEEGRIDNVAVLTGDIHSSWALDVARDPFGAAYGATQGQPRRGIRHPIGDLALPHGQESRGSPGSSGPRDPPHMRFIDLFHKGYVLIDITRERLQSSGTWPRSRKGAGKSGSRRPTSRPGATTISRQRAAPAPRAAPGTRC